MKPQIASSVSRKPSRTWLWQVSLAALALLALPGAAWADQVAIHGQVRFADGSGVPSAWVSARNTSTGSYQSLSADAAGNYAMYLPPGTYDLSASFSESSFNGSQLILPAWSITTSAQIDLPLPDIVLSGRVLNSSGQAVAGVQLTGQSSGMSGFGYMSPITGADGRFQVRILPGTYSNLNLTPPQGSPYAITPLPSETFSVSTSRDYVLANAVSLSGQVRFADGSGVPSAWISARNVSTGSYQSLSADGAGNYTMYLLPGTYDLSASFSESSFNGSQLVVTARSITTNTQLNLPLSDIVLSGRVLNSSGQAVAGVQLTGQSNGMSGFGYMSPITGADGRFQVRILPGTYSNLYLTPSQGSAYALTPLPSETFSVSTSRDYVLADALSLSGQARFADGSGVPSAWISARNVSTGSYQSLSADGAGNYTMYLQAGTYDLSVGYSAEGSNGSQLVVAARQITANTQLNLALSDIVLSGQVLNSSGQAVAGVQLTGQNNGMNGFSYMSPITGADGRFQVRILPGTYSNMMLTLVSGSGYLPTQLPSETFSVSTSRQYVIDDLNECLVNNGGCSVNATCTNVPGSRTCACNAGYTGDGITCQAIPGRIIVNEICANEPGSNTAGEFVELVNVGGASVDLSGWKVWDATAVRHTFAAGTVLAPGKALVVFGAASGIPAGLSNAVAATTGTLSLANTSDTVTVKDAAGVSVDAYTYASSLAAADGVSMNRSPDLSPAAGFVLHNVLSTLTSSAGKRANGTAF